MSKSQHKLTQLIAAFFRNAQNLSTVPKNEEKSGVSALNPNFMDVSCHIVLQPKFTIHLTYI